MDSLRAMRPARPVRPVTSLGRLRGVRADLGHDSRPKCNAKTTVMGT